MTPDFVATVVFEGSAEEVDLQESTLYRIAHQFGGIKAGAQNGERGYQLSLGRHCAAGTDHPKEAIGEDATQRSGVTARQGTLGLVAIVVRAPITELLQAPQHRVGKSRPP